MNMQHLSDADPAIANLIDQELNRQRNRIELIASENFVSPAVMQAMGSCLTNKYAEGLPNKRYYSGCEVVDQIEQIAINRVCELFGSECANVQPHSGASANMAVYLSVLKPGDTILGMNLSHGGHLTHGSPVSITGKYFKAAHYGVKADDECIDYDEILRVAEETKPQIIVAGASAYARTIDFAKFREIADSVGAYLMVDMAHIAGLVAAGEHPSPIPHAHFVTSTTHKTLRGPRGGIILCPEEHIKKINSAVFPGLQGGPLMHVIAGKAVCFGEALQPSFKEYAHNIVLNANTMGEVLAEEGLRLVSGGTDTHLVLVDVSVLNKTGKEVEEMLESAHITCNKNTIPFEKSGANVTSGIRLGTPAVTTRGMQQEDMKLIASSIAKITKEGNPAIKDVREQMDALCEKYPLYPGI